MLIAAGRGVDDCHCGEISHPGVNTSILLLNFSQSGIRGIRILCYVVLSIDYGFDQYVIENIYRVAYKYEATLFYGL